MGDGSNGERGRAAGSGWGAVREVRKACPVRSERWEGGDGRCPMDGYTSILRRARASAHLGVEVLVGARAVVHNTPSHRTRAAGRAPRIEARPPCALAEEQWGAVARNGRLGELRRARSARHATRWCRWSATARRLRVLGAGEGGATLRAHLQPLRSCRGAHWNCDTRDETSSLRNHLVLRRPLGCFKRAFRGATFRIEADQPSWSRYRAKRLRQIEIAGRSRRPHSIRIQTAKVQEQRTRAR